jgi:structural maintenance of chromosome 2
VKQGTISHIVNFKPKELLQLIEECAGVNYYNSIKTSFDRVLTRQDLKIRQVDSIYAEDLKPEMEKLQKEVKVIGEFREGTKELVILEKNKKKIDKYLTQNRVNILERKLEKIQNEFINKENEISEASKMIISMEMEIKNFMNDPKFGKDTEGVENEIKEKEKNLKNCVDFIEGYKNTRLKNKREYMRGTEGKILQYKQFIEEKTVDLKFCMKDRDELIEQVARKKEYLQTLQENVNNSSGNWF